MPNTFTFTGDGQGAELVRAALDALDGDPAARAEFIAQVAADLDAQPPAAPAGDDQQRRILDAMSRPGATTGAFPNVTLSAAPADPDEALTMGPRQIRDAALRMVNQAKDMPSAHGDRLEETIRAAIGPDNPNLDGTVVARRIVATEHPAYRSAFAQVMSGDPHPLLTDEEIRAVRTVRELTVRDAMTENTPAAGGYGVPVFIDPTILLTSGAADAPVWDMARKVPVTTNVWKGVTSAPVTFTFQTEAAAVTDASPTLGQPSVTVHTARGWVPYSIEVGQDYDGFAAEMAMLLSQGWVDSIASKTVTGSGSGEPLGVLTALDALTTSEVRVTTAGTFDGPAIFKVWNALPERFRGRANWLMSVSVESQIRSIGAGPQPDAYFTVDLAADGITRLNGRQARITDYMPAFTGTTSTANYAIVGDFSGVVIPVRQGMVVEPVNHVFQQVTAGTGHAVPTGQRGFFAWGRWGQGVAVPTGLRLVNQT